MCATIVHFLKSHVSRPSIPPFPHFLSPALASALNKTGAFAKTSITGTPKLPSPSLGGGLGSASDLLAMTSRLKGEPVFHNHFSFILILNTPALRAYGPIKSQLSAAPAC